MDEFFAGYISLRIIEYFIKKLFYIVANEK